MDLVSLMYRYINKLINGTTLLEQLKNLDFSKFSKQEIEIIKKLILDVEKIIKNTPNEMDEIEKKRKLDRDHILERLEIAKSKNQIDKKTSDLLDKQYDHLQKDREYIRDGGKLYCSLFELMTKNSLIRKYAMAMDEEELLDFITKYISVPIPPKLTKKAFNDLVKAGIKNDKRESLWRLAFNYEHKNMDFSLIENYFIEKRDSYYLVELICAVSLELNIDKIITKVISTDDKTFINDCADRMKNLGLLTEDQINKISI